MKNSRDKEAPKKYTKDIRSLYTIIFVILTIYTFLNNQMTNFKEDTVTISLKPEEMKYLTQYQDTLHKLFNKHYSLEEVFKLAMFFSLNINLIKLGIINSYDSETTNNEFLTKTKNLKKQPNKKSLQGSQINNQQTLDGIAPIKRVNNKERGLNDGCIR